MWDCLGIIPSAITLLFLTLLGNVSFMFLTPWELWWDKRACMIKINNKLKGRCQRQKHFRLGVVGGEWGRRKKIIIAAFWNAFRRGSWKRGIREESHDYMLKITVAVAESPVHMINQWNIKILQRFKPHNLVKSWVKRNSRPWGCWRPGAQQWAMPYGAVVIPERTPSSINSTVK